MKLDVALGTGDLGDVVARSRHLEEQGWSGLWTSEITHDPLVSLGLAAAGTTQAELGTAALVAFARSPMVTAYAAWDLQALSAGRLILGLGSQVKAHIERRFDMPWARPADRMRDYVAALRSIWSCWQTGEPLRHEGEFYRHTLMTPTFNPGPVPGGAPKVYLAAVGGRMARIAGEVADGVLVHRFTTPAYLRDVLRVAVDEGRRRSEAPDRTVAIRYAPFVATGGTEAEMATQVRRVRERIAFYASTPAYQPVLAHHGWAELHEELLPMSKAGRWAEMADCISDEVLMAFAVVAPHAELPGRLAERVAGLADRTALDLTAVPDETAYALRQALRSL